MEHSVTTSMLTRTKSFKLILLKNVVALCYCLINSCVDFRDISHHSLMMEAETASGTLYCSCIVTRLLSREDFIELHSLLCSSLHFFVSWPVLDRNTNFVPGRLCECSSTFPLTRTPFPVNLSVKTSPSPKWLSHKCWLSIVQTD
jgi:hypothetical protein